MRSGVILVEAFVLGPATGFAQGPPGLLPAVQRFVAVNAPAVAIIHVKLIDGTGAPARDDQTIVIQNGKITAVGKTGRYRSRPAPRCWTVRGKVSFPASSGCTITSITSK